MPNWDDEQFISRLFNSIPNFETYHMIIGGDFVQNADLDRSSKRPYTLTNSSKLLDTITNELDISLGGTHSLIRNLSLFFSHVHHIYSAIGFFLLEDRLLTNVQPCSYHSIVISDHTPASFILHFPNYNCPSKPWRFN